MTTVVDVALISLLAGIWLTAGLLADAMPGARTAGVLHRRARTLSMLVIAGAAALVAVALVARVLPGISAAPFAALLPAAPALIVLTVTMRRLAWVRHGAAAFAAAPLAPTSPALRAAAAHPLVATPLQITGLAALVGVPIAARLVTLPGAAVAGSAITLVAVAMVGIAVRHVLRHSRLSVLALAPVRTSASRFVRTRPR